MSMQEQCRSRGRDCWMVTGHGLNAIVTGCGLGGKRRAGRQRKDGQQAQQDWGSSGRVSERGATPWHARTSETMKA
jgi:hypothetical protein